MITNHTSQHTPQERRILALLATQPRTTQQLATLLGVQRRSAERSLRNLLDDGSAVWAQQGSERVYWTNEEGERG